MELAQIKIQLEKYKDAYLTLKIGIEKENLNDLERDGVIQRFEYTVELTWKTLKKFLSFKGEDSNLFAKEIFKRFYEIGIIEDLELFIKFLEFRNIFSHTYNSATADDLFKFIKKYYLHFGDLIEKLERKIK